ncbi:phosphate ABC transporter permease subunit PstC [Anoxybacillus sp. J5B_2022]|uniref:phosphate ABC transporter permease subunit PstC n=1 Tax=Anoxybacillus sp. J5B_2022 TaxID=3003246 RepID=UPI002286A00C|nr:phosphate ABC transporter permease subunit PstC [Anoxybacillus sp. J5B_2022]MCZ0756367.1 phosphate ABC transporter permease subunit PstC [Anoxybacillus sp. J5B_2022]
MERLSNNLSKNTAQSFNLMRSQTKWTKTYVHNHLFRYLCVFSALFLGITLFSIVIFISKTGLLVFKDVSLSEFFFSTKWDPENGKYGAAVFIMGTIYLTAITLAIATPISLCIAIYIAEIAPNSLKNTMRSLLDLLVGIPSIVYGYLGSTILIPLIRKVTGATVGDGILAASLVLTIMILPTITRIADDAICSIPKELREASYALGSTKFQMITKVLLPAAKSGILTGIILGMTRALGETMAVVMVIGNVAQFGFNLITPTSVLTSNIVMQILNVDFDSTWNYALYMMAFLLLMMSMIFIILIRKMRPKGVK